MIERPRPSRNFVAKDAKMQSEPPAGMRQNSSLWAEKPGGGPLGVGVKGELGAHASWKGQKWSLFSQLNER